MWWAQTQCAFVADAPAKKQVQLLSMNSVSISNTLRSRRSWLVLQLAAGVLVGGLAMLWAIRGLDASVVLSEVQHAEYGWIIVAFLCTIMIALIKVERWRALYPIGDQPIPFSEAFSALLVTQMVNVIVPIRAGEMVRIGLMKQSGQPGATTLSTITLEKTLDLVAASLVAASLVVLAVAPDWLQRWSGSALVLGFVILAGIVATWALREPLTRMIEWLLAFRGWLPERWCIRLTRIFRTMLDAFGVLTTRRSLVPVLVWTLLVWVFSPLAIHALFIAFDLKLPFAAAIVLMLAITFSNIVPSPPALIGIVQAIVIAVLGAYGVTQSVALGLGIILNVVLVAPLVVMGGIGLWMRAVELVAWLEKKKTRRAEEE
jgi:uncharacterized protein (TIRG00374 family)